MALDFPNSPTPGQVFTVSGATWTWDGVKWTANGTPVVAMGDNRLINGDMRIDQRNNGASGTAFGYTVDRWKYAGTQSGTRAWRGISFGPPSFPYSLSFAATAAYTPLTSDYFMLQQAIEADAVSDFAWGTASAQPVTLSFWVQSSLTGTFGGAIYNYAGTRSYPFTYSIPTANTWVRIVLTVPGDTAGTWVMAGNAGSMWLDFDLGAGATYRAAAGAWASGLYFGATGSINVVATASAVFYVTGVKLEIGSTATPFNRQSLAKSMADCQRYYQQIGGVGNSIGIQGVAAAASTWSCTVGYTTMRAAPTANVTASFNNSNAGTVNMYPNVQSMLLQANPPAAGAFSYYNLGNNFIMLSAEL
jgi:hypothetical protein